MSNKKDFALGIVVTPPDPALSGTSLTMRSGDGARMPLVPFSATAAPTDQITSLDTAEKILVTDVTDDTITFEREQGDTTAKPIAAGWFIANAVYADDIPSSLSDLSDDTTHRTVTDTEKSTWNAKQNALVADTDYLTPTTAATTYEPKKGADDNYVTDAEKIVIGNTSGTNTGDETVSTIKTKLGITTLSGSNTGDQTSIVGITGTIAQFNTACTDADFATGGGTATGSNTGDQVVSDATISLTDITTNDVSITKHGFAPKAPNDTGKFLRGDGTWGTPTASVADGDKGDITVSGTGTVFTIDNGVVTEAKQSLSDNTTNNVSTTKHGYAPKAPNDATKYLAGDGAWTALPGLGSITYDELLTGTVNGSNAVFTTAANFTKIQVYKNGVAMHLTDDFTVTGANQITFVTAPATGTKLTATYVNSTSTMIQGSNSMIIGEQPTGATDGGGDRVYILANNYVPGSTQLFLNGVAQKRGVHYTEDGTNLLRILAADVMPGTVDAIVNYQFIQSVSGNADTLDGYHANSTPTANTLLPLDANAKVNSNLLYNPYKFSVYRNAALTIGTTSTKVTFDTELFDTNNNFNNGTYTVPVTGYYHFEATTHVSGVGEQDSWISLYVNGSLARLGTQLGGAAGEQGYLVCANLYLTAGETVDCYMVMGTAARAIKTGVIQSYFSGHLISTL